MVHVTCVVEDVQYVTRVGQGAVASTLDVEVCPTLVQIDYEAVLESAHKS